MQLCLCLKGPGRSSWGFGSNDFNDGVRDSSFTSLGFPENYQYANCAVSIFDCNSVLGMLSCLIINSIRKEINDIMHSNTPNSKHTHFAKRVDECVSDYCKKLLWDSNHFNIPIASLTMGKTFTDEQLNHVLEWSRSNHIVCMYSLINPYCRSKVRMLVRNGFDLVDIKVTLEISLSDHLIAQSFGTYIVKADSSHSRILKEMANSIKWVSRFTLDERFNQMSVISMYSKWITSRLDSTKSTVFVAYHNSIEAGVLVCDIHEEIGIISLIGVSSSYTGIGIAKALLNFGLSWFSQSAIFKVKVVTQACNYPALSLYEGSGFKTINNQLWFHRWEEADE